MCLKRKNRFILIQKIKLNFHNLTDESFDEALLTRPIESYLEEKSDIDALFGYTSAVK